MRGWRIKTRDTIAVSKSVVVILTAELTLDERRFSRAESKALASTSRTRKKCGAVVQLFAVRSAEGASGVSDGTFAAASTSDRRISPSWPEPRTLFRFTFNSPAIRRAFGEIFGLPRETTSPGDAAFAFSD